MTNLTNVNELILIIYSVGCCLAFISVLAVCVCGCRKGTPKNDLLGLDGMVKITNPDENVNHLPSVTNNLVNNVGEKTVLDTDDLTKRPSGGSNPQRSLPDIPIYTDNGVAGGGDTSSELYATVDDKVTNAAGYNKRHTIPNGVEAGPSLSHQSSISQSDSNYARLKENPYDKVKKSENPYANLQKSDSKETGGSSREQSPGTSWSPAHRSVQPQGELGEHSNSNPGVDDLSGERLGQSPSPQPDIPAAPAVAGRVAASQDLPYMTPPIPSQQQQQQPQHFSGDSQDSNRGYTSISVREPLANIISQTPSIRNRRNDLDPHYSTVSDDSDEMYAAIVEPNTNIYANGSETYAQIQPVIVADVHGHPVRIEGDEEGEEGQEDQYEPAPQPPSVDSLKHVAHVHSRQASSSSCTSSVANLGSPKPEKRQANSPLPPPPSISPDLYSRIEKSEKPPEKDESHNTLLPVGRNLEDMYAKVHKNKKKPERTDEEKSCNNNPSGSDTNLTGKDSISVCSFSGQSCESESKRHLSSTSSILMHEHCYETLNKKKNSGSFADGVKIGEISGPESFLSDPGYEQVHRAPSDADPNYEVLRPQNLVPNGSESPRSKMDPGYEEVNKSFKKEEFIDEDEGCSTPGYERIKDRRLNSEGALEEPNYESMPSECDNYATINQKSTESESDPNYESVKYLDVRNLEPPYEQLHDEDSNNEGKRSKDSSDLSEYEQISRKQFETFHGESSSAEELEQKIRQDGPKEEDQDVPGYESIKEPQETKHGAPKSSKAPEPSGLNPRPQKWAESPNTSKNLENLTSETSNRKAPSNKLPDFSRETTRAASNSQKMGPTFNTPPGNSGPHSLAQQPQNVGQNKNGTTTHKVQSSKLPDFFLESNEAVLNTQGMGPTPAAPPENLATASLAPQSSKVGQSSTTSNTSSLETVQKSKVQSNNSEENSSKLLDSQRGRRETELSTVVNLTSITDVEINIIPKDFEETESDIFHV